MRFSGTGCQSCKHAKKKCDEMKPVCRRCARNGRKCFGRRQAFSVLLDENVYASRDQKRPQGPRKIAEPDANPFTTPLSRDLRSESVAYFFQYHLNPTTNMPLLMGVPASTLLSNLRSSPVLESAVSSIALQLFSGTRLHLPARKLALASYQESLTTLRTALSLPGHINVDACLLAICLLGRYEDAGFNFDQNIGIPLKESMQNRKHLIGAIALLEYWVNYLAPASAPTATINYARRILRKAAVFGLIDLPDWLRDGALFGEQGSMLTLDRISFRIIDIRNHLNTFTAELPRCQLSNAEIISALRTIVREIRAIDMALIECRILDADITRCTKHSLASHHVYPKQHFFQSPVHSYPSYAEAARCAHYLGYRILVNHLLISTLSLVEKLSSSPPQDSLVECHDTINRLTEDLMSIVPFGLDRFKLPEHPNLSGKIILNSDDDRRPYVAELMALPLFIGSTSGSVRTDYADWLRSQLADTGRLLGYGAMISATSTSWPIQKY